MNEWWMKKNYIARLKANKYMLNLPRLTKKKLKLNKTDEQEKTARPEVREISSVFIEKSMVEKTWGRGVF